jgi:hypothetical protein
LDRLTPRTLRTTASTTTVTTKEPAIPIGSPAIRWSVRLVGEGVRDPCCRMTDRAHRPLEAAPARCAKRTEQVCAGHFGGGWCSRRGGRGSGGHGSSCSVSQRWSGRSLRWVARRETRRPASMARAIAGMAPSSVLPSTMVSSARPDGASATRRSGSTSTVPSAGAVTLKRALMTSRSWVTSSVGPWCVPRGRAWRPLCWCRPRLGPRSG